MTAATSTRGFAPDRLAGLDEPVRRYFNHTIREGAPLPNAVQMTMRGRIKVGVWLPFTAVQTVDGRSFAWRARVGPLRVTDRYGDGVGRTEGRLFGRLRLFGAEDSATARSAATRAAIESVVFAPASVLPERGVDWRAESDSVIVARFDLPPEHPEVRVVIDDHGAMRTVAAPRWFKDRYVPFGGEILAERRFGDLVIPSRVRVGWWFGTDRYAPFFEADIDDVGPWLPG
jgi:hypothetical protein